ncbi:MAG: GNAT family N-acetyltransferase [Gammaproteobacteria bacterium]|nr:GNAT family N-acetyltransferase [Gammaproteobacteria bacterium]
MTIKWKSDYDSFAQQNIPEISDLNVLPNYRNHDIGTALINECEAIGKKRSYTVIASGNYL